ERETTKTGVEDSRRDLSHRCHHGRCLGHSCGRAENGVLPRTQRRDPWSALSTAQLNYVASTDRYAFVALVRARALPVAGSPSSAGLLCQNDAFHDGRPRCHATCIFPLTTY